MILIMCTNFNIITTSKMKKKLKIYIAILKKVLFKIFVKDSDYHGPPIPMFQQLQTYATVFLHKFILIEKQEVGIPILMCQIRQWKSSEIFIKKIILKYFKNLITYGLNTSLVCRNNEPFYFHKQSSSFLPNPLPSIFRNVIGSSS